MAKGDEFKIEAVDIPLSFERKIRTEEGDKDLYECVAEMMNDLKDIKNGVLGSS